MAINWDLRAFSNFSINPKHHPLRASLCSSKINFSGLQTRGLKNIEISPNSTRTEWYQSWNSDNRCFGVVRSSSVRSLNINQETESLLLNAVKMNFFERLKLAWRILFPSARTRRNSNASIAKQRLKMILFSDRCAVSDEAKQKIVSNIVDALSDYVEIDSEDKVQLSVSADADFGTVYSVAVPVRRVKPEHQEYDEEYRGITNIEYKDTGEKSGTVDVKFDFFLPNDK